MSEIEAERNLYKGKYRALLKLIIRTRNKLVHVTDHIEDEGDRAYFGSTNDADDLKALYREMMSWIWDATDETNRMKADPYATIREQRDRIAALEAENERLRSELEADKAVQMVAIGKLGGIEDAVDALRAENERLRKALEPFAEAGAMALISGRPPGEHVDAAKFIHARAALEAKP